MLVLTQRLIEIDGGKARQLHDEIIAKGAGFHMVAEQDAKGDLIIVFYTD